MWDEIEQQPDVLRECLNANSVVIGQIVTEINARDIKSVVIAARGTSDNAAIYGKYIIEILTGLPVSLAAPSVLTVYGGKLKYGNSLVIGISQSGEAGDAIEVIKEANRNNALTVTITNFPDSPLAKISHHLFCNTGLEKSVSATKTFTAELFLLACLVAEWTKNDSFKRELASVPAGVSAVLGLEDDVKEIVKRYRFSNECFVLARGINYPIALEMAIKIQESSYLRAKAFSTSDFYHGPIAMIEKNIPVIVFAPGGPSLKDVREIIGRLREQDADILVISDKEDICALGDCSLLQPVSGSDFITPFYNAVLAQMFACQLSLSKGLNPDQPRALKKVTITR
jgi:glucosamine--fructose-6-phosphate aminotransferase (isomerizing)